MATQNPRKRKREDPLLQPYVGARVRCITNDARVLVGELVGFDGLTNLVLSGAEEVRVWRPRRLFRARGGRAARGALQNPGRGRGGIGGNGAAGEFGRAKDAVGPRSAPATAPTRARDAGADRCSQRVFAPDAPVQLVPLGLYIVKGDNLQVVALEEGEFDAGVMAEPLQEMHH